MPCEIMTVRPPDNACFVAENLFVRHAFKYKNEPGTFKGAATNTALFGLRGKCRCLNDAALMNDFSASVSGHFYGRR